jgi:hypothetical protein
MIPYNPPPPPIEIVAEKPKPPFAAFARIIRQRVAAINSLHYAAQYKYIIGRYGKKAADRFAQSYRKKK